VSALRATPAARETGLALTVQLLTSNLPVRVLKLTLAYDGTAYAGWQRQANGPSVQALVEEALAPIEGRLVPVMGSGRTDAGVHALGQVASVTLTHPIAPADLAAALNARLPTDVRVLSAEVMPPTFHARFSAVRKTYAYRVDHGPLADPFERHRSWHVPYALDVETMRAALPLVTGTHDFAAFAGARSPRSSTVRTVERAELRVGPRLLASLRPTPPHGVLVLAVTGDGFLRHMVRNLAGTLVEIGAGRREPGWIPHLLASRDRRQAGPTAPACGLYLVGVEYE
jgi:tRNA pseudouridine38-40 synthase